MKRGNRRTKENLGGNPSAASLSESNTARLLHDLQVHQIELELQNEELIQTRARMKDAYQQYTDLYDFAPVGYFTLGQDGTIRDVNLAGTNLLGVEKSKLIKRRMALFVTETSRPVFNAFFEKLISDSGLAFCEMNFEKEEGDLLCAHMEATCFEGSHECRAVLIDITARKQVEEKLRESEEKFRSLIEKSNDGITLIDEQGIIIEWNPAQVNITGISQAQALGAPFWEIQHQLLKLERRRELSPQYLKEVYFQKSKEPEFLKQPQEIKIVAAGGEHKFLQTSSFSIKTQNGCRIGSITHDITERKQREMELKYTKASLEKANAELQAALARETKLAHTDALTGINNRRRLFELAEHEFEMAVRYQHPLAVIMFDIDHFKEVNDRFGHTTGDQILQRVAQTASQELRSVDVFGRYGGEEFVIILPMTNAQQAYPLAERIREQVATIRLPTEKGEASVTLSIGIVELRHTAPPKWVETLIRNADETMYHAKQAGRNRTEVEK